MLTFFTVVLIGSLAYALGSVSPGWFAGRARGLDLRFEGQETLGFVNAANVLGTDLDRGGIKASARLERGKLVDVHRVTAAYLMSF